jgi:hypothetical protein
LIDTCAVSAVIDWCGGNLISSAFQWRLCKWRQAEPRAEWGASMCRKEEGKAVHAQVAFTVARAIQSVNLRVRVQVLHALDVNDDHLPPTRLERKMRESLRGCPPMALHESTVVVVFYILAGHGAFACKYRASRPVNHLQEEALKEIHRFWWVQRIESLTPELRILLHLAVALVRLSCANSSIFVRFGYVRRSVVKIVSPGFAHVGGLSFFQ